MPPLVKKGLPPLIFLDERLCLAKSHIVRGVGRYPGINVYLHCRVSGLVAIEMLRRLHHAPSDYGLPSMGAVGAIVSLHDVGKVSPGFQNKILESVGISMSGWDPLPFMSNHAEVSQQALLSMGLPLAGTIAGKHHGIAPVGALGSGDSDIYGGPLWQAERVKLADRLIKSFGVPKADLGCTVSVHQERSLSGLVCVADWVASGDHFTMEDRGLSWLQVLRRSLRLI